MTQASTYRKASSVVEGCVVDVMILLGSSIMVMILQGKRAQAGNPAGGFSSFVLGIYFYFFKNKICQRERDMHRKRQGEIRYFFFFLKKKERKKRMGLNGQVKSQ